MRVSVEVFSSVDNSDIFSTPPTTKMVTLVYIVKVCCVCILSVRFCLVHAYINNVFIMTLNTLCM